MDNRILYASTNTGVIIAPPAPTDYIAGVQSTIDFEIVNPTGDWTEYLPDNEMQIGTYFDTKACVSFSGNNTIETQLNRSKTEWQWLESNGYIENGRVNLSDRFLAKMSGTTQDGNTLQKVCDTLRHAGAVPEKDWPYPRLQRTPVFDWGDFYAEIPQEVINKGQQFLEKFEIQYEWVQDDFAKHLKQAPLQIAIGLCQPWDDNVAGCGIKPAGHAIMLYGIDEGYKVLDQYEPYQKFLQPDYQIPWIMKIIIKPKNMQYEMWQVEGSVDVYLIRDGKKTLIKGPKTFSVVGDWAKIKKVTQAQLDAVPEAYAGTELGLLVKE